MQEFREGNVIAELAEHEDEVVKLQNWRIFNVLQENDIFSESKTANEGRRRTQMEVDSLYLLQLRLFRQVTQ